MKRSVFATDVLFVSGTLWIAAVGQDADSISVTLTNISAFAHDYRDMNCHP